jgi:hypothetical protein
MHWLKAVGVILTAVFGYTLGKDLAHKYMTPTSTVTGQ